VRADRLAGLVARWAEIAFERTEVSGAVENTGTYE
jgi:hypothetical protein